MSPVITHLSLQVVGRECDPVEHLDVVADDHVCARVVSVDEDQVCKVVVGLGDLRRGGPEAEGAEEGESG